MLNLDILIGYFFNPVLLKTQLINLIIVRMEFLNQTGLISNHPCTQRDQDRGQGDPYSKENGGEVQVTDKQKKLKIIYLASLPSISFRFNAKFYFAWIITREKQNQALTELH